MAAFVRCEECGAEQAIDSVGFVSLPAGWAELHIAPGGKLTKHQFCGLPCASSWARAFALAQKEAKAATKEERRRFELPEPEPVVYEEHQSGHYREIIRPKAPDEIRNPHRYNADGSAKL